MCSERPFDDLMAKIREQERCMETLMLGKLRELEMRQKELTEEIQTARNEVRRALEDVPIDFLEAEVQRRLKAVKAKIHETP